MDFSYIDDWMDEEASPEEVKEVGEGHRNVWVVAEMADGALLPSTLQAMGQAQDLAGQIGVYVYSILLGEDVAALGESLIAYGADRVLMADHPGLAEYDPEIYVKVLADLVEEYRPEILLLSATALGNDLAPRLAQRLNTGLISHCIKLDMDMSERMLLGTFPTLGGEVYHTVACPNARPQMATLQPGYFRLPYEDSYHSGTVQAVDLDLVGMTRRLTWIDLDATVDLPPVPLSKEKIIVSAGRGMGDTDGFALVEQLAEALGGVVAGSRGAFDEGWIAESQIVGVGGESIGPDLYVACGISGEIHHHYGLQDAKFIVAFNPDERAPIMKLANLAVVGDGQEVIPAILEELTT